MNLSPILAHGSGFDLFDYFPVFFIVGGVLVIRAAMKDAPKQDKSTRRLPTSHLSRQVHSAVHPKRQAPKPSAAAGFRDALARGPQAHQGEGRTPAHELRSGE